MSIKKKIVLKRKQPEQINEGLGRALGMGAVAAAAGEATSRFGPGAALPPGLGAAISAAWYVLSGNAKQDYQHSPEDKLQEPKPKEAMGNPNVVAVAEAIDRLYEKEMYQPFTDFGWPGGYVHSRKSPSSSGGNGGGGNGGGGNGGGGNGA